MPRGDEVKHLGAFRWMYSADDDLNIYVSPIFQKNAAIHHMVSTGPKIQDARQTRFLTNGMPEEQT